MNMNLVLATGLAYAFIGALIMFLSHRAIYRKATRIVAGYPKVLAALRAQRYDGRFGLIVLLSGNLLQVLAALGYSAPIGLWRYPAAFVAAVLAVYGVWRLVAAHSVVSRAKRSERAIPDRSYETRRSRILLEAARRETPKYLAREEARQPRDRSVVCLAHEWECRWWSDRFGVTADTLRAVVRQVGPMVADIERHFAKRRRYALAA
ncbi:MAG TPA: DUF3606 domain-containing protein [Burkholderiales bacterium]|nr:DUF3606 domain-containing protein [Burkholderiales bacterium]